jgi:CRP/FNR family transcriptional regulator
MEKLSNIFEPELVQEILNFGTLHTFEYGDVIIDYGKTIRTMPLVLKGNIKVMLQDEEGREILLYYISDFESCSMAYSCCMQMRASEIKAIAEDNVEIISIPHEKLDEWLCKYNSWKNYIMQSFNQRFMEMLKSMESVAFKKLDERLIAYLKEKQRIGKSSVIKASHVQIAEELGTSRVVISRLLKHLENEKKLLLYRNELKLLSNF